MSGKYAPFWGRVKKVLTLLACWLGYSAACSILILCCLADPETLTLQQLPETKMEVDWKSHFKSAILQRNLKMNLTQDEVNAYLAKKLDPIYIKAEKKLGVQLKGTRIEFNNNELIIHYLWTWHGFPLTAKINFLLYHKESHYLLKAKKGQWGQMPVPSFYLHPFSSLLKSQVNLLEDEFALICEMPKIEFQKGQVYLSSGFDDL
jgi:hypothetical protein